MLTGTLPFDDNNLTNLFAKIKDAKFYMPNYLTSPAKELIRRMIFANPLERITIPEIKNHPWYTYNLPFYLQIMDNYSVDVKKSINPRIFQILREVFTSLLFC